LKDVDASLQTRKLQQNQIFSTERITYWHCPLLAKVFKKVDVPVNIPVVHSNTVTIRYCLCKQWKDKLSK